MHDLIRHPDDDGDIYGKDTYTRPVTKNPRGHWVIQAGDLDVIWYKDVFDIDMRPKLSFQVEGSSIITN